ncbi:MAG TPA: hypothetical protein VFO95_18995 [Gemmatimonadales bacterium]|nr:hypothetical protein [Gemmatimonadales bacterium]
MTRRLVLCGLLLGCSRSPGPDTGSGSDSAFAVVQRRGAAAMGGDQYTSAHVFEPLPDGGRIVLQRDSADPAGTATIRAHMEDIAARFARGDFTLPGFVHAQEVPGTAVMAARRSVIQYLADTLPRGGEVRIRSDDATAIAAIHAFLAFQAQDHRAASHSSHPPP